MVRSAVGGRSQCLCRRRLPTVLCWSPAGRADIPHWLRELRSAPSRRPRYKLSQHTHVHVGLTGIAFHANRSQLVTADSDGQARIKVRISPWNRITVVCHLCDLSPSTWCWIVMVALWNRADHYIFILSFVLLSSFFLFSSPNLSRRRLDVCHTSTHSVALVWIEDAGLKPAERSRLAENTGRKIVAKNRHLGTIAQLCRAISSQRRHVSTIRKKIVKQQYVLHMSPQYGELRPASGWDRSGSLRHPCKF